MSLRSRAVLLIVLCAALAALHGLRLSSVPSALSLEAGWHVLNAEWHMRFGVDGPLFRNPVRRQEQEQLTGAMPPDVVLAPLAASEASLKTASGRTVGVHLLDSDSHALLLIPGLRALAGDGAGCGETTVFLGDGFRRRLGLAIGDGVHIGGSFARVGPDVPAAALRAIPGPEAADGIRCGNAGRPAMDRLDRFLILYPDTLALSAIHTAAARLRRQQEAFSFRWMIQPLHNAAARSAARQVGWLYGLEVLLALLACGSVVLCGLVARETGRGDADIRAALGETPKHRLTRLLWAAGREWLLVMPAATILSLVVTHSVATLLTGAAAPGDLTMDVARAAIACSLFFSLLGALLAAVMSVRNGALTVSTNGSRMTRGRKPLLFASAMSATLGAVVCVPAAFLAHEFFRHAQLPQGYEPAGLFATRLSLLDFERRSQSQWWHYLSLLRTDLQSVTGVSGVGYIAPAPWGYTGWPGVLAAESDIILNVGVSAGMLPLLAPTSRIGRDVVDNGEPGAYLVQAMSDDQRRQYLPVGSSIIGELRGVRFSPLDETGRPAIFAPLSDNVGQTVHLAFRAQPGAQPVADVQAVLDRHADDISSTPLREVDDILSARAGPITGATLVASSAALIAVALLGMVLIASVRLYLLASRKEMAIRMCLGAACTRLSASLLGPCIVAIVVGWCVGSMAGLALWHQIVALMEDHRLVQPWSVVWLIPAALAFVLPYGAFHVATGIRGIHPGETLKG